MHFVKKSTKVISSLLATAGMCLSVFPAYSQSLGEVYPGFSSRSQNGTASVCGKPTIFHDFTVSSTVRLEVRVVQPGSLDPTFNIARIDPGYEVLSNDNYDGCGEDDEFDTGVERATFSLRPGRYRISVGEYYQRSTTYNIFLYER